MGKSVVATNLLSRAKGFWGWFIKKSPAFIVLTSLTVVSVFGLGVGGTLAATGVITNPFTSANNELEQAGVTTSEEDLGPDIDLEAGPGPEILPPDWDHGAPGSVQVLPSGQWVEGSSWEALGQPNTIYYRFSTGSIHLRYMGPCPTEILQVSTRAQNYGYLSIVMPDLSLPLVSQGGAGITDLRQFRNCNHPLSQMQVQLSKCFNFSEVWVDVIQPATLAGFYKIPIPSSIQKPDCPPGSETNDPTKFFHSGMYENLENYPETVITPPTWSSPPRFERGPYVPSTPTPTSEPSPTPTTEPSPSPTSEPSPTPTSP